MFLRIALPDFFPACFITCQSINHPINQLINQSELNILIITPGLLHLKLRTDIQLLAFCFQARIQITETTSIVGFKQCSIRDPVLMPKKIQKYFQIKLLSFPRIKSWDLTLINMFTHVHKQHYTQSTCIHILWILHHQYFYVSKILWTLN